MRPIATRVSQTKRLLLSGLCQDKMPVTSGSRKSNSVILMLQQPTGNGPSEGGPAENRRCQWVMSQQPTGNGFPQGHSGAITRPFLGHSGTIPGPFWGHSGTILGPF